MGYEVSDVYSGTSLTAADLKGREFTLVVAEVTVKKFDNGNKFVVTFQNAKKSLVCNKTNAKRIAHAYGTNTDGWIGREIIVYPEHVEFQGNLVEAIRVRAPIKKAEPAGNGNSAFVTVDRGTHQFMETQRRPEPDPIDEMIGRGEKIEL